MATKTYPPKPVKAGKKLLKTLKKRISKTEAPSRALEVQTPVTQVKTHSKSQDKQTALVKTTYIFATGRRKTAVANIRLFQSTGDNVVNKKPLSQYFSHPFYAEELEKPLHLIGQAGNFHFVCHVNGGGLHSQTKAVQHALAVALSKTSDEFRKVLKKNGMLTRDDRKKERKKPGLKRARRAPQWAKR